MSKEITSGLVWKTSDGKLNLTSTHLRIIRENTSFAQPVVELPLEKIESLGLINPHDPDIKQVQKLLKTGYRGAIIAIEVIGKTGELLYFPISLHREVFEATVLASAKITGFIETIQKAILNRNLTLVNERKVIETWTCEYCKTVNQVEKEKCSHCDAPRK